MSLRLNNIGYYKNKKYKQFFHFSNAVYAKIFIIVFTGNKVFIPFQVYFQNWSFIWPLFSSKLIVSLIGFKALFDWDKKIVALNRIRRKLSLVVSFMLMISFSFLISSVQEGCTIEMKSLFFGLIHLIFHSYSTNIEVQHPKKVWVHF